MIPARLIVRILARSFVTGDFTEEALLESGACVCGGEQPRWLKVVVKELAASFSSRSRPRVREVEEQICLQGSFDRAFKKGRVTEIHPGATSLIPKPEMRPVPGVAEKWNVPPMTDFREVAHVLDLHPDDLGWFTDRRCRTEHYHYRWHEKKKGRGRRLIEIPKPLLKQTQNTLLSNVIQQIPPHECSTGFQRGRSIFDFVAPHCRKRMVLKLDLEDFFASITSARVVRLFMTAGYPEFVAVLLGRMVSNSVPPERLFAGELAIQSQVRLLRHHLPQGASTSPAVANLCAFRLDCRLSAFAEKAGVSYTRYADDLLFSGDDRFRRAARSFYIAVLAIIIDEGFKANLRKTRFMPSSRRQCAAGLVLNEKPNVGRREFDVLKAILHNCASSGWEAQNRSGHPAFESHLRGRIEWVSASNPERGKKLKEMFGRIEW